nr:hypothetical protein [Planococcus glaciei]
MTVILMIAIMVFIIGIQAFIPFFVKKTEVFGIYVPLEYSQKVELKKLKKSYALFVWLAGGAVALLYGIVFSSKNFSEETIALWGVGLQLAIILFSMALYLINHLKVKKEKAATRLDCWKKRENSGGSAVPAGLGDGFRYRVCSSDDDYHRINRVHINPLQQFARTNSGPLGAKRARSVY